MVPALRWPSREVDVTDIDIWLQLASEVQMKIQIQEKGRQLCAVGLEEEPETKLRITGQGWTRCGAGRKGNSK